MTSLLRNRTKEDYGSESVLVEQGAENLILSFGNLLNSAAQKASVISDTKETVEKRAKVNMLFSYQLKFVSPYLFIRSFVGSFLPSAFF